MNVNETVSEAGNQTPIESENNNDQRHLRPLAIELQRGEYRAEYVNSWAVVIGINKYDHDKNLEYAVNDAIGIAEVLVSRLGFVRDRVLAILDPAPLLEDSPYTLVNSAATKLAIEELLFTTLPEKTSKDDRVLIFYAGHGASRTLPTGEKRGYLVPADFRPGQWHTYIDLKSFLASDDFYSAKHIFYLFDACYSGLATTRAATEYTYEASLLTHKARQVLTAGNAEQVVSDKGPNGHSPFTGFVLKGLLGEAAIQNGDVITASNLMVYVREQVGKYYGVKQVPDFGPLPGHTSGGDFVFRLPSLALTAKDHLVLGSSIYELGLWLNDSTLLELSARQFKQVTSLSQTDESEFFEAQLGRGKALLAQERLQEAIQILQTLTETGLSLSSQAELYLGVAHNALGEYHLARQAVQRYVDQDSEHGKALQIIDLEWLLQSEPDRCFALLIGIESPPWWDITYGKASANDVDIMKQALEKYGFAEENIVCLVDAHATPEVIRIVFERLSHALQKRDTVVVYFTGWTVEQDGLAFFLTHDSQGKDGSNFDINTALSADELHHLIGALPTRHKTLIVDAQPQTQFLTLANQPDASYTLLLPTSLGELVYEGRERWDGKEMNVGFFTFQFARSLLGLKHGQVTYRHILETFPGYGTGVGLQPHFTGDLDNLLFRNREPVYELLYSFWENYTKELNYKISRLLFSIRHNQPDEILKYTNELLTNPASLSSREILHLARLLLYLRKPQEAFNALSTLLDQGGEMVAPEAHYYLGIAQAGLLDYESALKSLKAYLDTQSWFESTDLLINYAEWVVGTRSRKWALLIGISKYCKFRLQGPANDVKMLKNVLIERYKFAEKDITTILDQAATRDGIMNAFDELATKILPGDVVVVFFSGHVSSRQEEDGSPHDVFIPYDNPLDSPPDFGDIVLTAKEMHLKLCSLSTGNLTAILDPGGSEILRLAEEDDRYCLFVSASPGQDVAEGWDSIVGAPVGVFSSIFVRCLRQAAPSMITAGKLLSETIEKIQQESTQKTIHLSRTKGQSIGPNNTRSQLPIYIGDENAVLFSTKENSFTDDFTERIRNLYETFLTRTLSSEIRQELKRESNRRPAVRTSELLEPVVNWYDQRNEPDSEGHLCLGIAHAALGDYAKATEHFNSAIDQGASKAFPRLHYYLGQALYQDGQQLGTAIDELRKAAESLPNDPYVHFFLGQAIRTLMFNQTLPLAQEALRIYLNGGAPLGHADEIVAFLADPKSAPPRWPLVSGRQIVLEMR